MMRPGLAGCLVAFGDVEHVPAPIFMRLGRGRFGKLVRPTAIRARAAVCGSRFGGHHSLAVRLLQAPAGRRRNLNHSPLASLDSNLTQSEHINSKSDTEVLYGTTGSVCRDDCCRKRSGASIAGIHERHAGSGSRGSHQLGKTPIRPLPTRNNFLLFPPMTTTKTLRATFFIVGWREAARPRDFVLRCGPSRNVACKG